MSIFFAAQMHRILPKEFHNLISPVKGFHQSHRTPQSFRPVPRINSLFTTPYMFAFSINIRNSPVMTFQCFHRFLTYSTAHRDSVAFPQFYQLSHTTCKGRGGSRCPSRA